MSRKGAIRAVAILCASYPRDLADETVEIFVSSLEDLPDEALISTASELILTSRWLPSIAEIREASIRRINPGSLPPTEDQAWNEVLNASESVGRYGSPTWSHPAIGDALRQSGGFWEVCQSSHLEPLRRRFVAVYRGLSQEIRKTVLSRRLNASNTAQAIGGAPQAISPQAIDEADQPCI